MEIKLDNNWKTAINNDIKKLNPTQTHTLIIIEMKTGHHKHFSFPVLRKIDTHTYIYTHTHIHHYYYTN